MSDQSAAAIITPDPPNAPTVGARPFWMPDTRGFLALIIVLMVGFVLGVLLIKPMTIDERTASLLNILLGVLIATFKDVFSYFFNSTQASEDKSKTIAGMGASLANSVPAPLVSAVVPPPVDPALKP